MLPSASRNRTFVRHRTIYTHFLTVALDESGRGTSSQRVVSFSITRKAMAEPALYSQIVVSSSSSKQRQIQWAGLHCQRHRLQRIWRDARADLDSEVIDS